VGPGNIVTCTAVFADRFNNALGLSTLATFASEAGSAGPPASTPQYDSTKPPGAQTTLGIATDFVNVTGGNLPADVAPFDGEYRLQYVDACGDRIHNPRDGLVTVIVTANGEEGFVDMNGNGTYDAGEPFVDMGEPYIDANDSGQRDPGETFVDVNGTGSYDGPNGVWDANTVIWTETRVLYSGAPKVASASGLDQFSRTYLGGLPPTPTPTPSLTVVGATGTSTSQDFGLFFTDGNFNAIGSAADYTLGTAGAAAISARFTVEPSSSDALGMGFTQQYCDQAPPGTPTSCSSSCQTAPCYLGAGAICPRAAPATTSATGRGGRGR
jgi:hypothetical protein